MGIKWFDGGIDMNVISIDGFEFNEDIPLTKDDFTLNRFEQEDGHEDYWFKTSDRADEFLCHEYIEQGCEHVFEVVYSKDEDIVGIKRQYRFNWDVTISPNLKLKKILKDIINGL